METENLFANTGEFLFILLDGKYYQRIMGKGWKALAEKPEGVAFHAMPEKQAVLFRDTLADKRWRAD
jgi:hypothetical protein